VVARLEEYLEGLRDFLENTTPVADLDPSRLDVVFVVGGHGPMQDLAVDPNLSDLFTAVLDDPAKVLAAVCHGPASFLSAHRPDGTWLFKGRRLTGFSNEEETQAGFAGNAPWLLEDRLRLAGAQYAAASAWTPHAEVDGNLVTGQQNYSAQVTADAVMNVLSSLPRPGVRAAGDPEDRTAPPPAQRALRRLRLSPCFQPRCFQRIGLAESHLARAVRCEGTWEVGLACLT
jgi:putative intracellular protease/amidase